MMEVSFPVIYSQSQIHKLLIIKFDIISKCYRIGITDGRMQGDPFISLSKSG